jgi:hypothetical protein
MFKFNMLVVEKDSQGYYHTRWDCALPVSVYAATLDEAAEKVKNALGKPLSDKYDKWIVKLQSVEEVL